MMGQTASNDNQYYTSYNAYDNLPNLSGNLGEKTFDMTRFSYRKISAESDGTHMYFCQLKYVSGYNNCPETGQLVSQSINYFYSSCRSNIDTFRNKIYHYTQKTCKMPSYHKSPMPSSQYLDINSDGLVDRVLTIIMI
jgi:hypothetical protein